MEAQPNPSTAAASHLKDSRPAREEIESIVNGLTRFDHGLTVRDATAVQQYKFRPPPKKFCLMRKTQAEILESRRECGGSVALNHM